MIENDFEVEQNEINPVRNNNYNLRINRFESNNFLDWVPLLALSQSDYAFPGRICCTFQNLNQCYSPFEHF